jgi:hypothetical protein
LVLLLVGAWRFPESVTHGPLSPAGTFLALLVYGGASEWARRATSDATQPPKPSRAWFRIAFDWHDWVHR